eukprot:CAMPEP_0118646036 /NCGR_PEP_ID=MMETSP0785-20121206/7827_1 /TAXON_ID=91992 /ORGANISM="Bolidomonas pacifica, Strain CCMP 1866" /LENGTH=2907 /DNA_ID=CAMNT_0006537973 /DNA_START=24 /DNA_END=8743 /DNA_ORIENTATION=+
MSQDEWTEMSTDDGTPFYVNNTTGQTQWSIPKSLEDEKKKNNPHYPWKEVLSPEGATYYWNELTSETLWDMPQGWEDGEPVKGRIFGRWTECVGVDGAYFWDEKTGEVCWEIEQEEMEQIKRAMKEIKEEKKATKKSTPKPKPVISSKTPTSTLPITNPVVTRPPSPAGTPPSTSKRGSVVLREKQLEDIRRERKIMAEEKAELQRLKKELLDLKEERAREDRLHARQNRGSGPRAPRTRPPKNRRTSAVLGVMGKGLTIADGFSITNNHRDSNGLTPGSSIPPTHNPDIKLHSAKSSKGFRGLKSSESSSTTHHSHHSNQSNSRHAAGPTLAKAFFPEKSGCQCCHGYIYGCDEQVCYELGKCICSLEEGEGTGDVKKKKGKYEFIEIKSHKRERSKTQASRQALGNFQIEDDEEDLSGMQKFVKCLQETFSLKNLRKYVRIPTYRQVLRVLYKWPYIWYLHASRFFFGSFQDPQLASSSERQYLGHRFQIDPEESATALGLLAWRKSAMLVIMVMAVFVVAFDLNRINMTMNAWVYSDEAKAAPSHHGLSGFPPRDITSKYMSVRAQNYLNVTKPNTWSTVSGMWRVETDDGYVSDLCLQPGGSSNANDIAGKSAKITQCTRDSQWLHGSDKKYFFDEEQMLLSKQPGWWTIDTLTRTLECDKSLTGAESFKIGCANQTKFTWRSYDGLCLEATIQDSAFAVTVQPCSSTLNQRWTEVEVPMKVVPKVSYPQDYKLHKLQNREFTDKCLAIEKSELTRVPKGDSDTFEGVLKFISQSPVEGVNLQLRNCDGSEQKYEILTFRAPRLLNWNETAKNEEVDLSKRGTLAVGSGTVLNRGNNCSFLSVPTSSDFWPVEDILDVHPTCVQMSADPITTPDALWARWNVAGMRYDRFSTYVGLTSGLELKNEVYFQILITTSDSDTPKLGAELRCGAQTIDYSWNGTVEVTRNFCTYTNPQCNHEDLPPGQKCLQPMQAVDILLPVNAKTIELRAYLKDAQNQFCDSTGDISDLSKTRCDGLDHVGFGSPRLHSHVRDGEEGLAEYTDRILKQMNAEILVPSFFPRLLMDYALLLINLFVIGYMGWAIKWWTTYKESRTNLGKAWLFCFVGPLIISCIPLRLTMDWNCADHLIVDYTTDIAQRYEFEHRQQQVVNTCQLILSGEVESELEAQLDMVVDFCGHTKEIDIDTALDWAKRISEQVDESELSLEWVSPYGEIKRGFPSTCYSATGEDIKKTCTGNSVFDLDIDGILAPPPCSCGANCELVGFCGFRNAMGETTYLSCAQVIPQLNCSDMPLLSGNCQCSCGATDPLGANETSFTKEEERCRTGFIENVVPKMGPWSVELPILGEFSLSTYKVHYFCGEARGYMYEAKYDMALLKSKEACREYLEVAGGDKDIWEQNKTAAAITKSMDIGKKLSSTTVSYDHAMDTMVLALPAALSIGPALMIGSLRAKTMVPQSASAGMFVVLLPWLYAPVIWCIFNFAFQFAGNLFILPGLMFLAFVPMVYFILGSANQITRPLAKEKVKGIVKWASRISCLLIYMGLILVFYGVYVAYYYDDNNEMFRKFLKNLWDGYEENNAWEWENLLYLLPPFVNTFFKYCLTTVLGVDFIMYELIHQRMYEIFLEDGIDGVMMFSAVRPRHFDYTTEEVEAMSNSRVERLSAFSKLIAAPTRLDEVDKAIKRKKKRMKASEQGSRFFSRLRSTFSRRSGETFSSYESKSTLGSSSTDSTIPDETGRQNKRHSRKRHSKKRQTRKHRKGEEYEEEDPVQSVEEEDEEGEVGDEPEKKKKSRIYDLINEGQPGLEFAIDNYINYVLCTLIHIKRSKSKLMESKKMASQQEIDYLSATHGLQFNKDSSLCFELITWRRSALWVLVLFGITNMFFGITAFVEHHTNVIYDRKLSNNSPTHRFPVPGYVDQEVLDYWNLKDPSLWTLYFGSVSFNNTKPDSIFREGRTYYMGVSGETSKQTIDDQDIDPTPDPGGPVSLKSGTFSHGNDWDRFSLNMNGTLRNGRGFCVTAASDTVGADVTVENCVSDFIGYDTESEALKLQTWIKIDDYGLTTTQEEGVRLKSPGGLCLGIENWKLCADMEKVGTTDRCAQWKAQSLCDSPNHKSVASLCPVTCELCSPDEPGAPGVQLGFDDTVDLKLVDCVPLPSSQFKESEALLFDMPNRKSYQQRMDYLCDGKFKEECAADTSNSHVNMDMTLVARYDYGHPEDATKKGEGVAGLIEAPVDKLWRCYSTEALNVNKHGGLGNYNREKQSRNYCTKHEELKEELKKGLGIESFADYTQRMIAIAFVRMNTLASSIDEGMRILILTLSLMSVVLSMVSLQVYSRYKLSRSLMLVGWFVTFLGPFLSTIMPLRMFLDWESVDYVAMEWAKEFDDEYGTEDKEKKLLSACRFIVEDVDKATMLDRVLDICADDTKISAELALEWGDTSVEDEDNFYKCTTDYLDDQQRTQSGYGYPAIKRDPCKAFDQKGQWLQGIDIDLREICESGEVVPYMFYEGLVPRLLKVPFTEDPWKIDLDFWDPLNPLIGEGIKLDMSEALIQCGKARRMICGGEYDQAIRYAKRACNEAIGYLDGGEDNSNANYVDKQVTYWLRYVRESIELAVCTRHALHTFKTMTGATFALAPALIRSALKVKTAVPQSPMTGMFIIVLPWLYSPLVWVVFNVVFQLIGNWQLLVGLMAFAFGPMAFFVVGILKNVTRPFDDLEAKKMVKIFEITQALKVGLSGVFIVWGLWVFSFRENSEYFEGYKDKIFSGLSILQGCNLFSTMAAKYFYTTVVGVDYMLNQILYARKHEVLMLMHEKSDMWGQSTQAKLAATIHKDYVKLLNLFCKIQDKADNTERAWKEWKEEVEERSSELGRSSSNLVGVGDEGEGVEMTDVGAKKKKPKVSFEEHKPKVSFEGDKV